METKQQIFIQYAVYTIAASIFWFGFIALSWALRG